jgi:hypothetical protein
VLGYCGIEDYVFNNGIFTIHDSGTDPLCADPTVVLESLKNTPEIDINDRARIADYLYDRGYLTRKEAAEACGIEERQFWNEFSKQKFKDRKAREAVGGSGNNGSTQINSPSPDRVEAPFAEFMSGVVGKVGDSISLPAQVLAEQIQYEQLYTELIKEEVRYRIEENVEYKEIVAKLTKWKVEHGDVVKKKLEVIRKLRNRVKSLKQTVRRRDATLAVIKLKVKAYREHNVGIDITDWDEAQKWEALMKLAYDSIEREVEATSKKSSEEEKYETKETLKALFEADWRSCGQVNKAGDKRGVRGKIYPRVMHAAIDVAYGLKEAGYERLRRTSRWLPSWSTLVKYKRKVSTTCPTY